MSAKTESRLLNLKPSDIIGDWVVVRKLGRGGCGAVFEVCVKNSEVKKSLAMKVESRDLDHSDQLLRVEASILRRMQHSRHVPIFVAAGRTSVFNFLLMELVGKSLSELHKAAPRRQFTIATVLKIALQALSALHDLHNIYFVHRDVKPANFATGLKNVNLIYILDFGLSRQFAIQDPITNTLKLRKPRSRASFRGTVAYCSINVHKHLEQGRHDDLWSMMYMLIEFIAGRLPWKGLDRKETAVIKQTISNRRLLQGCPKQFGIIIEYLSMLTYYHRPDYEQIEKLFLIAIERRNIDRKAPFEWGAPKAQEYSTVKKSERQLAEMLSKMTKKAPVKIQQTATLKTNPMENHIEATQCA